MLGLRRSLGAFAGFYITCLETLIQKFDRMSAGTGWSRRSIGNGAQEGKGVQEFERSGRLGQDSDAVGLIRNNEQAASHCVW